IDGSRRNARSKMIRRVDVFATRLGYDQPNGVLDHPALTFIITHQRRKHWQARGVAGGPAGRPQSVGVQIEFGTVRSLPAIWGQLHLPRLPNRTDARRDDDP